MYHLIMNNIISYLFNNKSSEHTQELEEQTTSRKYPSIRGKTVKLPNNLNDIYTRRVISIDKLISLSNNGIIKTPNFQRIINPNKIDAMKISFKNNSDIFTSTTNNFQLICMSSNDAMESFYLLDGQHRLETYKQLLSQDILINRDIEIVISDFTNYEELINNYKNLNCDREIDFICEDEVKNDQFYAFRKTAQSKIESKFKTAFKKNDKYYTSEQFCKKIFDMEILEYFDNNIENTLNFINVRNNIFIEKYYNKCNDKFMSFEEKMIDNKIIITLKNNNFIEFLTIDDKDIDNFKFKHTKIRKKKSNNI